ncbi:hypothetical protein BHL35_00335 [Bacillus cereus]|nr:hypothetical protein BHL35_00335 [Bacillus cereus]
MLRSKSLNYNRFNSKWSSEDEVSIEIQPIIDYCDALQTSLEEFITTVHLMMLNKYTNEDSIYTDLYHLNSTSHCYLEIKKGTHFNKLINQLAHSQNSNDLSYTFVAEKEISQDVLNKYQYIMGISFEVTDKNIKLKLYFQNPLIPQWYAKQYLQHFLLLLNEILKEDNRALDTINWNTDMDIKEIESFCNGPKIVFDFQTKLDEIFSRVATENSNSIAVVGYEGSNKISFTYKELNDRVNALALELQDLNVIENDPVVVHMERGIGVIISLLAIFKVGGVYIPIDTTYPEDYINYIIKDTGAKVIIRNTTNTMIKLDKTKILYLDIIKKPKNCYIEINNHCKTEDPCMIMYTSGSTGKPKGVVHSQRQIINRLYWMWNDYPFDSEDRIAQRSPINVMPSIWELIGGLLHGRTTVVIPDAVNRNPTQFLDYVVEHQITFMTITPTIMNLLVNAAHKTKRVPSFKLIIVGGEFLEASLFQRFMETFKVSCIVNDFGATETNTIFHTQPTINSRQELDTPFRPITNVSAYIFDENIKLLPFGIEGEIYIAGPNLALEYLNLQDITKDRFVYWTNSNGEKVRVYGTGDMGYLLPDGSFYITGRKYHQVKINGMKVELGEVEKTIIQLEEVSDCVVVEKKLSTEKIILEAYIVKANENLTKKELLNHISAKLPSYMVPKYIEFIEAIERLPNGKKNRKAYQQQDKKTLPENWKSDEIESIKSQVTQIAAEILERNIESIAVAEEFSYIGFDSISIIQFSEKISEFFDINIAVVDLFNYPTIAKISDFISQSRTNAYKEIVNNDHQVAKQVNNTNYLAIIGMSGRFPGAEDINIFWDNLCQGKCCIKEIPIQKWDAQEYYDPDPSRVGKSYSKWGGFLEDIDTFDPLFFNISPEEAKNMDPQQRLCLMESYRALEDAGYSSEKLVSQQVGVFIGARQGDYKELISAEKIPPNSNTVLGNDLALLAARISYFHDFTGPSLVVDTACSSSLTALHLACQSLKLEESDVALVGGVCITNHPNFYIGTSKMNIFSPSGECRAFDNKADGFVHGEGVAFIVVKPLERAIRDKDRIYSVICGTAINQDGHSNGITAPNGEMQTKLQTSLYKKLNINPSSIGYIEAHGTGTKLGDHIELNSLLRTYENYTNEKHICALGSVKPNIGHLTAAAGISGLIKSVLCLYKRELVPSIHYKEQSDMINLENSPFYINTLWKPWVSKDGGPLRAAINSFGIGGTNVHCVLEEPPRVINYQKDQKPYYLIPISAKTDESLNAQIKKFKEWLQCNKTRELISDLSFTLLRGRDIHEKGWVFIVNDMQDLENKLNLLDENDPSSIYFEKEKSSDEYFIEDYEIKDLYSKLFAQKEYKITLRKLANYLIKNKEIELEQLFKLENVKTISAPQYVFRKERYWINTELKNLYDDRTNQKISRKNYVNQNDSIFDQVKAILCEILGMEDLDSNKDLEFYGFSSVKAIDFKYRIEKMLNTEVSVPELIQHTSLKSISDYIVELTAHVSRQEQSDEFYSNELNIDNMTESELIELLALLEK